MLSVDRDELDELSVSRLVLVLTEQLELLELLVIHELFIHK